MAFYQNKEERALLLDKIVQLLTTKPAGTTAPYWKQVQSGTFQNEGYILYSEGRSGNDNIFVRFHYTTWQNKIVMSMMEGYTPNSVAGLNGVIVNESHAQDVYFYNAAKTSNGDYNNWSSSYSATHPVHYFLSFNKDKIMLVLKGDPGVDNYPMQTLAWIGMPQRLTDEPDSTAVTFAVSTLAYRLTDVGNTSVNALQAKVLVNRNKQKQNTHHMHTMRKFKSKGWGGHFLLPNIYLQSNVSFEGVRSIMDGVHPLIQNEANPDFKDGDEITVGAKRYTIFMVSSRIANKNYDVSCFPSDWMAVEQLS